MAFELEALVGHVYVVGGKVIKTNPPGALCEVAPRKCARGREADTFFVLVLPSGNPAPVSFYEQMAMLAAERYFAISGSVSAALKEMLTAVNNSLYEHNVSGRKPYETNIICAVLRGSELTIARVGACAAVLRHSGLTLTYPENLSDEDALYQPPLGVRPIPEVLLKRYSVDSGTRFVLVDASVAELKPEALTQALVASNIEQVLEEYKLIALGQTQAMVVELVRSEVTASVPVVAGDSSKTIVAELATLRAQMSQPAAVDEGEPLPKPSKRPRVNPIAAVLAAVLRAFGRVFTGMGRLIARLFGQNMDSPKVRYSTGFLTTAIFALPLMVVLVVVLSWVAGIGETRFEECVRQALEAGNLARSLDSSNPNSILAAWEATLLKSAECEELRPNDPSLSALRREGLGVIDRLRNIERRALQPLATIPNSNLTSLVLRGLDLYALDKATSLVYRFQIGADGKSLAGTPQPLVNMRRGASVDGLQLGTLIDIAFDDQLNVIAALDRGGVLVRCPPRFVMQCEAQRVLASETWQNPIAITIWQGTLYVLDTVGNQLWRYQASGGNYASVPTEYFVGSVRPDLSLAVDFAISTAGNTRGSVYTLFSNGVMMRHFGSEPQPFAFAGFPEGQNLAQTSVNGMFLNDSPIDTAFYIISPAARTIYETSIAGSFIASYRVFEEEIFSALNAIAVEPAQQLMYVAAGDSLYVLSKSR